MDKCEGSEADKQTGELRTAGGNAALSAIDFGLLMCLYFQRP